jgi:hypothetical protein
LWGLRVGEGLEEKRKEKRDRVAEREKRKFKYKLKLKFKSLVSPLSSLFSLRQ